jgi:hypothetical protein
VSVVRRLRVAYFSTGDEILSLGEPPREGAVYDSNRYTVHGMLQTLGCEMIDMGVVKDDPSLLEQAFSQAAEHFHVTLRFGVFENEIPAGILGRTFTVRATENCFGDRIHALRVELPNGVRSVCLNKHPHMTISMLPGVRPVESNVMLQSPLAIQRENFGLSLVCEFVPFN